MSAAAAAKTYHERYVVRNGHRIYVRDEVIPVGHDAGGPDAAPPDEHRRVGNF